tara:strand:- start:4432 stop:4710 length:279 start_codon:yes stop_codon:yes gene_type:complete
MFDTNKQLGGRKKNTKKPAKGKKCGGSKSASKSASKTVRHRGRGSRVKKGGVTLGDALVPAALYAGLRYLKRRPSSRTKKSTRKMSRKSRSK